MKSSFGNTLKALRKQCGLTQSHVAERLNVSPQAVSKWETGSCYPDISLLPLIADMFCVSTDRLLSHTPPDTDEKYSSGNELELCKQMFAKAMELAQSTAKNPNTSQGE